MKALRRVALLMDIRTAYDHGVARGIMRYARDRSTWRLFGHGWTFNQVRDARTWDGHGIITRIHHPTEAHALLALGVPVVDVCRTTPHPQVHSAANDDVEAGRLAGRHHLGNGHRHFAYCGADIGLWSQRRRSGFAAGIGIAEEHLPTFLHPDAWWRRPGRASRALTDWLRRLPLPVAIFAGNDYIGVKLANACAQLGLTVPDQVALVGVDNEEVLCEFANPPLSSVPCDTERMGYAAARLLDRLMEGGESTPAQHIAIPPLPLVVRASSNRFTTSDAAVLAALRRIHHGGGLDLGVPEAVAATGLSRRALELRFRSEMGRSIHDEIIRARLLCACQLLTTTADPIRTVATASGFASAPRFHQVFRTHLGMPPTDYRRRHRPERERTTG